MKKLLAILTLLPVLAFGVVDVSFRYADLVWTGTGTTRVASWIGAPASDTTTTNFFGFEDWPLNSVAGGSNYTNDGFRLFKMRTSGVSPLLAAPTSTNKALFFSNSLTVPTVIITPVVTNLTAEAVTVRWKTMAVSTVNRQDLALYASTNLSANQYYTNSSLWSFVGRLEISGTANVYTQSQDFSVAGMGTNFIMAIAKTNGVNYVGFDLMEIVVRD